MADLGNEIQIRYLKIKLGELYPYIEQIKALNTFKGIQARMPYDIQIN
jgi:protease-4